MKIAFDVAQTCVPRGGIAWFSDSLARALAALLSPDELMLYHHLGIWGSPRPQRGTHLEGYASPQADLSRDAALALWEKIEAGQSPLPGDPDLIHSTSLMAPKTPGAKLVYTVHDLCFWTHPELTSERNRLVCQKQFTQALSRADAFHFISQCARDDFETVLPGYLKRTRKPSLVAHSGSRSTPSHEIDAQIDARLADPHAPWIYVGAIEPRKNVDALLDAYLAYAAGTTIPRPLEIVGRAGWNAERTQRRIEEMAKTLPVHQRGYLPNEDLETLWQKAFGLVYPSLYEGFGLPVLEAMSHGMPVLCHPSPAIKEFGGDAVQFIDFAQPANVGQAMLELERDTHAYRDAAKQVQEQAKAFTWAKTASALIPFYRKVLTAPPPTP